MGLVKLSSEGAGIGQNFFGSGFDWSNFLQEQVGLVKHSVGVGRIGQNSFGLGLTKGPTHTSSPIIPSTL